MMRTDTGIASQFGTVLYMSTQIAVRLPDEIVAFVDEEIKAGRAKSRAQVVLRALEREQRRQLAVRDVEIPVGESVEDDGGAADVATHGKEC